MKKTETTKQTALSYSEIAHVYTCWEQGYSDAYKNFTDYLKVAISGKEITGTVYR